MRRRGWWHAPVLILLSVVLLVALLVVETENRKSKQKIENVKSRASAMELERDHLMTEIDLGEQRCSDESKGVGTEQLLMLDLDERIFTQLYPLMRELELPGVLGLERDSLPGMIGKLSRQEFDELLAAGWGTCLICPDGDDFDRWDQEITAALARENIPKPCTVYFPEGAFSSKLKEQLLQHGYTIAIHHGEDGLLQIPLEADEELWLSGAHPWIYNNLDTNLQLITDRGGEHCFTLSFGDGREAYEEAGFLNMLELLVTFRDREGLTVTTFEGARPLQDPQLNGAVELRAAWEEEKAALRERINELDQQIWAVYDTWDQD